MGWIRKNWGLTACALLSLLALIKLLLQKVPGHFRVFSGAGNAIWHLQDPYANDFGTHVGYYFYSPACALMVFGPISVLPEKLGMVIYMGASWAVFVLGAMKFYQAFGRAANIDSKYRHFFWMAVAAQLFSGILASKLEVMIAGILLLSISLLFTRPWLAATLLAMILNWKFQPLPVAGLALLSWILIQRDIKLPATFAAALGGWYLLPYLFIPAQTLAQFQVTWMTSFTNFLQDSVLNFENIFAFVNHATGLSISLSAIQVVTGVSGVALALFTGLWLLRELGQEGVIGKGEIRDRLLHGGLLLSAALGSMFMTVFSPLGQNNAMILYAPLLLAGFVCLESAESKASRYRWIAVLGIAWAIMTLSYSDLLPRGLRDQLRQLSVKPLACLMLGIAVALEAWWKRGYFARVAPESAHALPEGAIR